MTHKSKIKNLSGFTMIELLVAMGLFAILSGIVAGSFIGILRTQKTVLSLIAANDNANLAMEQMAREIRTGRNFSVSGDEKELCFVNALDQLVDYKFDSAPAEQNIKRGTGSISDDCRRLSNFSAITASGIRIKSLNFYLHNTDSFGGPTPSLITVALKVAGLRGLLENIEINLDTSISSRIL